MTPLTTWPAPAPWILEIERVTSPAAILSDIRVTSEAGEENSPQVDIGIESVIVDESGMAHGPFWLTCPGSLERIVLRNCVDGRWTFRVSDSLPEIAGNIDLADLEDGQVEIESHGRVDELSWKASLDSTDSGIGLYIGLPGQSLRSLDFLMADIAEFDWISAGNLQGEILVSAQPGQPPSIKAQLDIVDVGFDSPDGLYAGLGVDIHVAADLGAQDDGIAVVEGRLSSGEILLADFYRDFSGAALDFEARVQLPAAGNPGMDIRRFSLSDGDALQMVGQARIPPANEDTGIELILREFRLDFPQAYERYLEPVATVYGLDGLVTSGALSWTGDWSPGSARSGILRLEELSVDDSNLGRFTLTGLDGVLQTGSASRVTWDAASFEKIDLGAGNAAIALTPETIRLIDPLAIDVFGGQLELSNLAFTVDSQGEPDIQLQASIEAIEMLQMSQALGWPAFGGTLSGTIPGINWADGVIEIEGALDFEVFDGRLMLTDLRVERPFGVLPSLSANITATGLDLEELTQTFEFGRIAGRADGYVRDLRMLDWQPVQFDAWFGTSGSDGEKHDISRQAVSHLTTLGGGSATTLLTGPVLRFFNNFSYRRLGLGCELRNNVCRIRGIEDQGEAVLLMEGAGIPKISILAYNRSVDWPQLLAELNALTSGEKIRIGE